MNENMELPPEAIMELQKGNIIGAIKHVRSCRNIGLKEAKDAVDSYLDANPEFRLQMSANASENNARALKWLVIMILLGATGFIFWKFF